MNNNFNLFGRIKSSRQVFQVKKKFQSLGDTFMTNEEGLTCLIEWLMQMWQQNLLNLFNFFISV